MQTMPTIMETLSRTTRPPSSSHTSLPFSTQGRSLDPTVPRGVRSKLTQPELNSLDEWLGERVQMMVPRDLQNMVEPPDNRVMAVHYHAIQGGLQFPPHPLTLAFLASHNIAPCQLTPNGHRFITCFITRCREVKVAPSLSLLLHLFHVNQSGPFLHLQPISGYSFVTSLPSLVKNWKEKFVYVSYNPGAAGYGFSTAWVQFVVPFAAPSYEGLDADRAKLCGDGPHDHRRYHDPLLANQLSDGPPLRLHAGYRAFNSVCRRLLKIMPPRKGHSGSSGASSNTSETHEATLKELEALKTTLSEYDTLRLPMRICNLLTRPSKANRETADFGCPLLERSGQTMVDAMSGWYDAQDYQAYLGPPLVQVLQEWAVTTGDKSAMGPVAEVWLRDTDKGAREGCAGMPRRPLLRAAGDAGSAVWGFGRAWFWCAARSPRPLPSGRVGCPSARTETNTSSPPPFPPGAGPPGCSVCGTTMVQGTYAEIWLEELTLEGLCKEHALSVLVPTDGANDGFNGSGPP
nr:protein Daple-like [Ipomoea batatas]